MKKIAMLMVLATLAGCATVAGVGEDISSGSRSVQNMF